MEQLKQAYPLQWPLGYKRSSFREISRFRQSYGAAQESLKNEISRLGGRELVVSTNMKVNSRGDVYASELGKNIFDPGVAIYFKYKGKDVSMCCDKYKFVWENMYALSCGIEALRGMERWGVSEFLDRAFTGFAALPPRFKKQWWAIFGFEGIPSIGDPSWRIIQACYRDRAKFSHPDTGGSKEAFQELVEAFDEAKKYYGRE